MSSVHPSHRSPGVVAAFDFDKTLSTRDCVLPFLRDFVSAQRLLASMVDLPRILLAGVRRDRDVLKAIVTRRTFAGVPRSTLEDRARKFARHVRAQWMRPDTLEKLHWHKEQGHHTGLVSASYGVYLRPIADDLGLDFVIASELEFDASDRATGRLLGGNCRGPEKARRLQSWLGEQGLVGSLLYAYGDSSGDRELLAMSDVPHLVTKGVS